MSVRKIVKFAVGSLAGSGAAMVVNGIISEYTRPRSLKQRCAVIAARVVLSSLALEVTRRKSDKMIDETFQSVVDLKKDWADLKKALYGETEPPTTPPTQTPTAD